jgi:cell wall-associated NlpC family hydrolase
MQQSSGSRVSLSALQPGDLVFYGSPVHHVALYVGGGQVIHAPQSGDVVRYAPYDMMTPVGATRPG